MLRFDPALKNVRLGYIPVGAPVAKRLALSVLSLRVARLPAVNGKVLSRVAGNWVSVLQYRKCFSCVIDDMFRLANACLEGDLNELRPLPRAVSCELAMLGALALLVFTNVTAGLLDRVFATDASNQKGAIIGACIEPEVHGIIWADADRKGCYTHLNNPFNVLF